MLPAVELLGLPNTSLMVEPELAVAPVIPPVLVPSVHAKVLGALAARLMLGLVLLQVLALVELVTAGVGLTVTVILVAEPAQEPVIEVGVTA
jgi:hypothetical protein